MTGLKGGWFLITWTIYVGVTSWLFRLININQTSPYMDEIFHIRQAKKYCEGNFSEWDQKITTPPGLYIVSVGILVPVSCLLRRDLCTVNGLRGISFAFMIGNFYLVYLLHFYLNRPHHNSKGKQIILSSLNLMIFPVLHFFTYLYYTDSGAVFFVLMMYLFHLMKNNSVAALFGLLATLFRQTSIVWVFFIAILQATYTTVHFAERELSARKENTHHLVALTKLVIGIFLHRRKYAIPFLIEMLKATGGYLLVGISFILFVIYNEGIVLGDRSAHQACLNFTQILYFLGFMLCFCSTYLLSIAKLKCFVRFCKDRPLELLLGCAVCLIFIHKFSFVHQYLLADNRHFTFYVWRRILGLKYPIPLLYIPLYLYAAWSLIDSLRHTSEVWMLAFVCCVCISVVPQKLLEFRYFIIPYLILRLNMNIQSWCQILGEFVLYVAVNIVVFYLFLYRPFKWEGSEEIQRFIW